jgi:hypothetical protein
MAARDSEITGKDTFLGIGGSPIGATGANLLRLPLLGFGEKVKIS